MARVPMLTEDTAGLDDRQREVARTIAASRGEVIRPFQVLLHSPDVAEAIAEVGARLRFGSGLPDHDRELATLTVGASLGCAFVWDSHVELATAAGVRTEVLEALRGTGEVALDEREALVIDATRELCAGGRVGDDRFAALARTFDTRGAVEFTATVGYYVLLGTVMAAADAC